MLMLIYVYITLSGSLKERHIENGSVLYAIFTPKENLKQAPKMPKHEMVEGRFGEDTLRCHIMLKVSVIVSHDYENTDISSSLCNQGHPILFQTSSCY